MVKWLMIVSLVLSSQLMMGGESGSGIPMVMVMQRVDTSDPDARQVIAAWVDSLDTWRGVGPRAFGECRDRPDMPVSSQVVVRDWFSQSLDVIKTFPPTILSVERANSTWVVRTLFSFEDHSTGHLVPLGILRTTFERSPSGNLQTVAPFPNSIENWETHRFGLLEVVVPPGTPVSEQRAWDAVRFIKRTAEDFDVDQPDVVTIVLAPDRDAMCALLGVEYYAYPPSGLAFPASGVILSSLGDPYYPHEYVHVVLRNLDQGANPIIREGVATWLGGSINTDFGTLALRYLERGDDVVIPSFLALFTDEQPKQDDQYVLGAVILDAAYRRQGMYGVRRLLMAKSKSETMLLVARLLDIDPADSHGSLVPFLEESISAAHAKPGR
jgi:hypothetical protein